VGLTEERRKRRRLRAMSETKAEASISGRFLGAEKAITRA